MELILEIETGVYDKPYRCKGTKKESDKALIYEWTEKREADELPSNYTLTLMKGSGSISLKREGPIKSDLKFQAGIRTRGTVDTGYGIMDVTLETKYVNMPNIFTKALEISYLLPDNSELQENIFVLREV